MVFASTSRHGIVCLRRCVFVFVHVCSVCRVCCVLPPTSPLTVPACLAQLACRSQEISCLEDTVSALQEDYQRSLHASAASQKDLQQNLVSAKHDLLRVQDQLALAEKVLHCSLGAWVHPGWVEPVTVGPTCHSIPSSTALTLCVCVCPCPGAREEVPTDCSVPQHEGNPHQEERADQGDQETTAEVSEGASTLPHTHSAL